MRKIQNKNAELSLTPSEEYDFQDSLLLSKLKTQCMITTLKDVIRQMFFDIMKELEPLAVHLVIQFMSLFNLLI